jgi:hypothetical protein
MWALEYSEEVKSYFVDNYPYTFALLVKIEELKFLPDANPEEEYTQLEPNFYRWTVLDHHVLYEKQGKRLYIWVVKPIE